MVGFKAIFRSLSIYFGSCYICWQEIEFDLFSISLHIIWSQRHSRIILMRLYLEIINEFLFQ